MFRYLYIPAAAGAGPAPAPAAAAGAATAPPAGTEANFERPVGAKIKTYRFSDNFHV